MYSCWAIYVRGDVKTNAFLAPKQLCYVRRSTCEAGYFKVQIHFTTNALKQECPPSFRKALGEAMHVGRTVCFLSFVSKLKTTRLRHYCARPIKARQVPGAFWLGKRVGCRCLAILLLDPFESAHAYVPESSMRMHRARSPAIGESGSE